MSNKLYLLIFIIFTSKILPAQTLHQISCHILDKNTLLPTQKQFVVESHVPRSKEDLKKIKDIKKTYKLTVIKDYKFPKYPGIDSTSFGKFDDIDYSVEKRPGKELSFDYENSYRISEFKVSLGGEKSTVETNQELIISSKFNFNKKIPKITDVIPWHQRIRYSSEQKQKIFSDYLVENDIAGSIIFINGENRQIVDLIQCRSLSNNNIFYSGASY